MWDDVKTAAMEVLAGCGAHGHPPPRRRPRPPPRLRPAAPEPFAVALRAAKAALDPAGVLNPGVLDRPRVERDRVTEQSAWMRMTEEDPEHSAAYVQRFRDLAEQGMDLVGEARLVDAMLPRGSRVLDAGCGPGPGGRAPARGRSPGGRGRRRPGADRGGRGGPPRPALAGRGPGRAGPARPGHRGALRRHRVRRQRHGLPRREHPARGAAPDARARRPRDARPSASAPAGATSSTTSWPTPAPWAGPRTCCCPPGTCGRSPPDADFLVAVLRPVLTLPGPPGSEAGVPRALPSPCLGGTGTARPAAGGGREPTGRRSRRGRHRRARAADPLTGTVLVCARAACRPPSRVPRHIPLPRGLARSEPAVGAQQHQRVDRPVAAPLEGRRGGVAGEVDGPAAVVLLPRRQPVQLGLDHGRGEQRRGPGRPGSGAKSSGRMNSSSAPPATCSSPSAGRARRSASTSGAAPGRRPAAASSSCTANASSMACGSAPSVAHRRQAVPVARVSHGCSATAGSTAATRCAAAATTAVICSDDSPGRPAPRTARSRPGRARAARRAARRRAASPTPASRTPPPARGVVAGAEVGERLERVQRTAGLAGPRAQVGLQPPAVAAVGVAVALDRGEDGVRRRRRRRAGRSGAGRAPGRARPGRLLRRRGPRSWGHPGRGVRQFFSARHPRPGTAQRDGQLQHGRGSSSRSPYSSRSWPIR